MKKVFKEILSLFKKTELSRKRIMRKTRGQSFVEFAITLPLLLMLLASVVEYGFMLNYYLSMLDATRTAARFYSGLDPFQADHVTDNMVFYNQVAVMVQDGMNPLIATPGYVGRTIPLDPLLDDIIVSVYGIEGNTVYSHPDSGPYHFYSNGVNNSIFNATNIATTRVAGAPNEGLLVVEIHYKYHQILALPWLLVLVSNPVPLQAYTIMPIRAAEPVTP